MHHLPAPELLLVIIGLDIILRHTQEPAQGIVRRLGCTLAYAGRVMDHPGKVPKVDQVAPMAGAIILKNIFRVANAVLSSTLTQGQSSLLSRMNFLLGVVDLELL